MSSLPTPPLLMPYPCCCCVITADVITADVDVSTADAITADADPRGGVRQVQVAMGGQTTSTQASLAVGRGVIQAPLRVFHTDDLYT